MDVQASKKDLIELAKRITDFAEDNLKQLGERCQTEELMQDFYLGLIRRQSVFSIDFSSILNQSLHNTYISLLILSRCIIDDYIRLTYIQSQTDPFEALVKMNADAYKKIITNLEKLADVNEKIGMGKVPYYPTKELVQETKEKFKGKEKNKKYFDNIEQFKLKSFPSTRSIIESFALDKLGGSMNRAFYIWRHLSDYVHYSNCSFELEINPDNYGANMNYMQECIFYSYKVIKLSFVFFEKRDSLKLIDRNNLDYFYSNADID